jgi:hypothetical protein
MVSSVQIAVVAAAVAHTASAYSSYMELIPNGENIGKTLGHTDTGYTDFGTLFSDKGTEWSAVCGETWPGGSVLHLELGRPGLRADGAQHGRHHVLVQLHGHERGDQCGHQHRRQYRQQCRDGDHQHGGQR